MVYVPAFNVPAFSGIGYSLAIAQLGFYLTVLNGSDPQGRLWRLGTIMSYRPPRLIALDAFTIAVTHTPTSGVILYQVIDVRIVATAVAVVAAAEMDMRQALATLVSVLTRGAPIFGIAS